LFEADVDSHRHAVEQINSHAGQVIHSCSPSSAALIEGKLQELNQGSLQLSSACRERLVPYPTNYSIDTYSLYSLLVSVTVFVIWQSSGY